MPVIEIRSDVGPGPTYLAVLSLKLGLPLPMCGTGHYSMIERYDRAQIAAVISGQPSADASAAS